MSYGMPDIHPSAKIAPNATVVGDVHLSKDTVVLFGAVLRGDCNGQVYVGERTNIQDLVCVHVPLNDDTVIGSDVSVGHAAILHGCTIGDGTLVGMGAIVLDGAKIGKNCLIGAGALVTGTADIPDGMLVLGSPARAVRPLTSEEIEGLKVNVEEYLKIGKDLDEAGLLR